MRQAIKTETTETLNSCPPPARVPRATSLLVSLPVDDAQRLAAELAGADAEISELRGRGSCNRTFVATTGEARTVIRLNRDRDPGEYAKEAWCMARAAKAGISVAIPLRRGFLDGWNYGIQTYEGEPLGEALAHGPTVWHWLGETARTIGSIAISSFGDVLVDPKAGRFDGDWRNYVADNQADLRADSHLAELLELGSRGVRELEREFEVIARTSFEFGLAHGDLRPDNIVDKHGRLTLVDWGCAHAHIVPHFELMEILRHHDSDSISVRAFLDGNALDRDWPRLRPEVERLMLLRAFDLVRWARDRKPARLPGTAREFRSLFERFIAC